MVKSIIRILAIVLAVNFCYEIVVAHNFCDAISLEIDLDGDSEKEESKKEKESDKVFSKHLASSLSSERFLSFNYAYSNHWKAPMLEIQSPPPELI